MAKHLRRLFAVHHVDLVLDVGANRGQYARFLREFVGYDGDIHSFEPTPELASHLRKLACRDPRWVIHECALGETKGEAVLNVTAYSELNSLMCPVADAELPDPCYIGRTEVVETVSVPVLRADAILSDVCAQKPFSGLYIKADTQGFDLPALRGVGEWLDRAVGVQAELSFQSLYKGAERYSAVIDFLHSHGLELSGMFPVSRDAALALIEADGVFVRAGEVRG